MKVLVATDSFKGSMTSIEAGNAIKAGILATYPQAYVKVMELADGGEGTCRAISNSIGAQIVTVSVNSPIYGEKVNAEYAIKGKTAIIEMAQSSGIMLVSAEKRNPMFTTTYGVGEMILDALNRGCTDYIIGIGGSATNDCGTGMLKALGFSFLDKNKNDVGFGAESLKDVSDIKTDNVDPDLKKCRFTVACDVTNPLCGNNGCSYVFARQKGASDLEIEIMDKWISSFAKLANNTFGSNYDISAGSGAAGGLGYAFFTFLNAKMKSGSKLVLEETGIINEIDSADIVITGEGRFDSQSLNGKAPITLAKIAKEKGKKTLVFCGSTGDGAALSQSFVDSYFSILHEPVSLKEALKTEYAINSLTETVTQVFRLLQ